VLIGGTTGAGPPPPVTVNAAVAVLEPDVAMIGRVGAAVDGIRIFTVK